MTAEDYQQFGQSKSRSVGRPWAGSELRISDQETLKPLPPGQEGLIEVKTPRVGTHWIRTTDLGLIDEDGFVYHCGRADGAINRGGFKILPETVRRVLVGHPSVLDAAVVGVPDRRLGEVPFAAIEVRRGARAPTEAELKELVREALPSHHVPVAIACVDELPRNAAMKVRPADVAALHRP